MLMRAVAYQALLQLLKPKSFGDTSCFILRHINTSAHTHSYTHVHCMHPYARAHIRINSNSSSVNYISPTMSTSSPQPTYCICFTLLSQYILKYNSNQLSLKPLEKRKHAQKKKSKQKSNMKMLLNN